MKWWNWMLCFALSCMFFIAFNWLFTPTRDYKAMFDDYIQKFNKSYKNSPEEYATRFQYFVASIQEIDQLNSESPGPDEHRALYGLTKLSDMSKEEYKEIHLSDEQPTKRANPHHTRTNFDTYKQGTHYDVDDHGSDRVDSHDVYVTIRKKRAALPMKVDWRDKGMVGPIRNQGLCGACWAFSTVGVMESMMAMNTGKVVPLSVQEVIDCAGLGNSGCSGGDICLLLDWLVMTDTAVQNDSEYPLSLRDGVCRTKQNSTGVRVKSFTCDNFVKSEDRVLAAIATHGPVSVAVNALTWQNYLDGVIQYHCSGSPADLNHAVQLVGYDLEAEVPYYIAKNSWGTDFGNGGYLKLAVGSNICGLANEVATVDLK